MVPETVRELLREEKVVARRDHAVERTPSRHAVVGMNDAGAIAYYGNRRTVDLLGLTSQGFAKAYRSGIGCMFERLRRLPPGRRARLRKDPR